jgi:hypothetical protein
VKQGNLPNVLGLPSLFRPGKTKWNDIGSGAKVSKPYREMTAAGPPTAQFWGLIARELVVHKPRTVGPHRAPGRLCHLIAHIEQNVEILYGAR